MRNHDSKYQQEGKNFQWDFPGYRVIFMVAMAFKKVLMGSRELDLTNNMSFF